MAQEITSGEALRSQSFRITGAVQARLAAEKARSLAESQGFPDKDADEIALVVFELGTNLLKHAGGGELKFNPLEGQSERGLEIVAEDNGPGIADVEQAIADGYSTVGGLGQGLGTVNRLMDSLEFCPRPHAGLRICCQRWVRPAAAGSGKLQFGAASRPYRFLPQNGDSLVLRQWPDHALAGVIDGLGHGPLAQRAAQTAREYVENHYDRPLADLFRGAGRACRATRGVGMALVRFELRRQMVIIAGIGNIEVRLLGGAKPFQPLARRGVVGQSAAPQPLSVEAPWTASSTLVLHSDGVQAVWSREPFGELLDLAPAVVARQLLDRYGRLDDDATVLVIKPAGRDISPSAFAS